MRARDLWPVATIIEHSLFYTPNISICIVCVSITFLFVSKEEREMEGSSSQLEAEEEQKQEAQLRVVTLNVWCVSFIATTSNSIILTYK